MAYTKRTCNKCGMRRPQPEMVKRNETSISASTNLNRKNSTRFYGRPKTVFYCKGCVPTSIGEILIGLIVAVIILGMVL